MSNAQKTKDTLLLNARLLFWTRGFSNVPLREIARASSVDVALISRYFGSKLGLFEATIEDLPFLDASDIATVDALIDSVVEIFTTADRGSATSSATTLIVMNAYDPDVGELIRTLYRTRWQDALEKIIGDKSRAAMFSAAMFGISIAEKALHLDGIAAHQSEAYEMQLRELLRAAVSGSNSGHETTEPELNG